MSTSIEKLPNKELLRPDEVANYFGVSVFTIYRWIDAGKLQGEKIGDKIIRIDRKNVLSMRKEK